MGEVITSLTILSKRLPELDMPRTLLRLFKYITIKHSCNAIVFAAKNVGSQRQMIKGPFKNLKLIHILIYDESLLFRNTK
jgi:hypothetical protein